MTVDSELREVFRPRLKRAQLVYDFAIFCFGLWVGYQAFDSLLGAFVVPLVVGGPFYVWYAVVLASRVEVDEGGAVFVRNVASRHSLGPASSVVVVDSGLPFGQGVPRLRCEAGTFRAFGLAQTLVFTDDARVHFESFLQAR